MKRHGNSAREEINGRLNEMWKWFPSRKPILPFLLHSSTPSNLKHPPKLNPRPHCYGMRKKTGGINNRVKENKNTGCISITVHLNSHLKKFREKTHPPDKNWQKWGGLFCNTVLKQRIALETSDFLLWVWDHKKHWFFFTIWEEVKGKNHSTA